MSNHANLFLSLDIIFDTSEAVGGHLNEVIVEQHSHALMSTGIMKMHIMENLCKEANIFVKANMI